MQIKARIFSVYLQDLLLKFLYQEVPNLCLIYGLFVIANGLLKYYAVNVQEIFKISFTSHLLEFDQNSLAIHFLEIYQKKLGLTPFVIVKLANAQCSCVSKNEKEKKFREILPP